jgi:DNA polymerase-1
LRFEHLSTAAGLPTNAVFGVGDDAEKTTARTAPDRIAVCFDTKAKTLSARALSRIQGHPAGTAPGAGAAVPADSSAVQLRGLPMLTQDGYEADESDRHSGSPRPRRRMDGGDCHRRQGPVAIGRMTECVVFDPMKDTVVRRRRVSARTLRRAARTGHRRAGLGRRHSDNIPGVPGVGEKTAIKLVGEYGDLEGVLANAGSIKGKLGEKVRAHAELARLSRDLATIKTDVPLTLSAEALTPSEPDPEPLRAFYAELEFRQVARALPAAPSRIDTHGLSNRSQ